MRWFISLIGKGIVLVAVVLVLGFAAGAILPGLITGSQKAPVVTTSDIVSGVRAAQELATVNYNYETVGVVEKKGFFADKKLIVTFCGTIKYGFDLKDFSASDVKIDSKGIVITLPKPRILSNELNLDSQNILHQEGRMFFNQLEPADMLEVQKSIKARAEYNAMHFAGIDKMAKDNAQKLCGLLVQGIDKDTKVVVITRGNEG